MHKPAQDSCFECHSPHGGSNRFFTAAEGRDLCAKCHGDFLKETEKVAFPHAPMTEGKSCQNCHSSHFSNQEHLLSQKTLDLCLECHNKKIVSGERTLNNIKAEIDTSKNLHGPIREGNCVACHAAHGSNFTDILDKNFPRDFYAPYAEGAYDLCFECHDRNIVEDAKSTTTNFRNGVDNLHYTHVNREKGRTCRACHTEHASNQAKHIREEVPYGAWKMKLKFDMTTTGGTCATGCHIPYKYDRENPVENLKPKAQVEPKPADQPAQSNAPDAATKSPEGAAS
jgi:predicted CXXCH cytochrome family protein